MIFRYSGTANIGTTMTTWSTPVPSSLCPDTSVTTINSTGELAMKITDQGVWQNKSLKTTNYSGGIYGILLWRKI